MPPSRAPPKPPTGNRVRRFLFVRYGFVRYGLNGCYEGSECRKRPRCGDARNAGLSSFAKVAVERMVFWMHRTVFFPLSLAACAWLAAACSTAPAPNGGGSGSGTNAGSGSGSGTTASSGSGSGSGSASGGPMCSGSATVSFKNDIIPLFRTNCAKAGACHNDPMTYSRTAAGGGRQYLGTALDGGPETMADMALVYAGLSKPSLEYTSPPINYVVPCDPANSYLMIKMDPTFTNIDLSHCAHGDFAPICGLPMPSDSTKGPLPQATRDIVRNWISQGALNN